MDDLKQDTLDTKTVPAEALSADAGIGRHECGWCGKRLKQYTVTNGLGVHRLLNPHKDRNGDRCLHSDALLETSPPNGT